MCIKLGNLLNLQPSDIGNGFVQTVRLDEHVDDAIVVYCENENNFHKRYQGTGNDVGLVERFGKDPRYAQNFEFAILGVHSNKKSEKEILKREC